MHDTDRTTLPKISRLKLSEPQLIGTFARTHNRITKGKLILKFININDQNHYHELLEAKVH